MKSAFLLIVACFISFSYTFGQNLDNLNWILGEWEMVDGSEITTESWEMTNDSTFMGKGIFRKDEKVVFEEGLSIELRNGQVTYIAVLPDKTAYFKLTDLSMNSATFEDVANDFPNKIVYELNG
ncbi:MAG: DUF6265 family protein, partial [Flavobacteriales bacterium]|nr:DUF6265 family protein [Flavobacteriales bacterium]